MAQTHYFPADRVHYTWDTGNEPVLTIESGDTVAFSCLDSGWHVAPGEKFDPRDDKLDEGHALVGPIEVAAQPFDLAELIVRLGNDADVDVRDVRAYA